MFNTPIYVTKPSPPPLDEYIDLLELIWDRKVFTNNGTFHVLLERSISDYIEASNVSLINNGTIALLIALKSLGVKSGEVITTPFTFPATVSAIEWLGLTPIYCDIKEDDFTIDEKQVESKITENTVAILPVHVFGKLCNVVYLDELSKEYDIPIIYDAAHTFGVKHKKIDLFSYGRMSTFSFHATKVFTTVEGGMIVSNTPELKHQIDLLKNFGIEREEVHSCSGINGKMNELQAAFGILQLRSLNEYIAKRKKVHDLYMELLSNVEGLQFQKDEPNVEYNYAYFPVVFDSKINFRSVIQDNLKQNNVFARRYFYPLCSDIPGTSSTEEFPVAKYISENILCLPIYPELDLSDVKKICRIIKEGK